VRVPDALIGLAFAGAPIGSRGVVNALLVFAAIVFFMLAAPGLGFLATTAVLLFALMR
jgi:hypothetical protein